MPLFCCSRRHKIEYLPQDPPLKPVERSFFCNRHEAVINRTVHDLKAGILTGIALTTLYNCCLKESSSHAPNWAPLNRPAFSDTLAFDNNGPYFSGGAADRVLTGTATGLAMGLIRVFRNLIS